MNFDNVINHGHVGKEQTWKKMEYLQRMLIWLMFWIPNNYMSWNNS